MIKWFKNRKSATEAGIPSTCVACCDTKTGKIIAIKGETKDHSIEHENYHVKKKHPSKPRDPLDYATQELEANLYAYDKTGQPKQICSRLIGIHKYLQDEYYLSPTKVYKLVTKAFFSVQGKPNGWSNSYERYSRKFGESYLHNLQ